jgi:hypothetical protein
MRLFTVTADATTGEWDARTLVEVGTVDRAEHLARADTDTEHFDTFEHDGETCAVIVRWAE